MNERGGDANGRGAVAEKTTASGALLPVIGVGNAKVKGANGELVGLGNVLLVKGLSANLLSVRRLQKSKAEVTFGPTSCRAKLGKKVLWSLEEETSCIKDLVVSRPSHEQLEAAKRLVRYVSATASVGLEYSGVRQRLQRGAADVKSGEMLLSCYTDASFNSVKADGTSIGGYVCLLGGGALAKNACLHGLTKHIRPKWHWVRRLLDKEVRLEIVKTHQQAADIFTKRLAEADHWKGMKLAGMSVH
ncbi:hypothetical protein CLOP_g16423 [Closterium sp. NIES-67]|nr:hypothetical protein CLOP_g16423 [Closterium sp. NIES-67]